MGNFSEQVWGLSGERHQGGDWDLTFALYEWNIEASAAALSLAAMVEVVVRNALDARLTDWARQRNVSDWLEHNPLDSRGRADIQKATQRAALMALGEIPQGRSSNFPTLGGCHCSGRRVPVAA